MSHLDDLPKRHSSHRIEEQSKTAFRVAISECEEFAIQSDDCDYGTDFQIEAVDGGEMTNVRVHVQLKGTTCEASPDGSVSVSVARTNVSYLLMQPGSIFVCYHILTRRLLVCRVDDVVRLYEHRGKEWCDQQSLTVRFKNTFDHGFQQSLREYVVASARGERDRRLNLAIHPPETLSMVREEGAIDLPVPADPTQAKRVLVELYEGGQDRIISLSFDKFRAVLGSSDDTFLLAYMAEINLGINGTKCDQIRIRQGIDALHNTIHGGQSSPGSVLYSIGNGWLALKEFKKARDAYNSALLLLDESKGAAARCSKNLGTALEKLNHPDAARSLYERALELDPNLAEAHFALGLWHYRHKHADLDRALDHLDAIVWPRGSAGTLLAVQGWRAEILFRQRRTREAIREVRALLHGAPSAAWVWPWCARLVSIYGKSSVEATQFSISFWGAYLEEFRDDLPARKEILLCVYYLHDRGERTGWDYERFRKAAETLAADGDPDAALLWDRAGHWAQMAEDWQEAETCFRRAFQLSPNEYGYCLGTALNFLHRYEEAIAVLLPQATEHQPDAMSWFQLAVAREGIGDVHGCIDAYKQALALDEGYDRAWFNLGGAYWNSGNHTAAVSIWKEAIRLFPTHPLSSRLKTDLPHLLG
ncbi:MAG: tetratricopeptide repeat protein [Gemmatimonadetes bacterium]|nr:tetratricopeptide repeat protein [Gemmatimonadota bacterium]